MEMQGIKLDEKRDFSDVLNASFRFMREEFKPLFGTVFLYSIIPLTALSLISVFYSTNILTTYFQGIIKGMNDMVIPDFRMYVLMMLLLLLSNVLILGITYEYIAVYNKYGKGNFNTSDVLRAFTNDFFAILGYSILSGIVIFFATVFFIIPGIYIAVPISMIFIVKAVEGNGFSASWGRCFRLVKNNWWITFAIILVAYIIVTLISSVLGIPLSIYIFSKGLTAIEGADPGIDKISFGILHIISTIGTYMMYIVLYVIIAFQYFSLRASKDSDTIIDKINKIGEQVN